MPRQGRFRLWRRYHLSNCATRASRWVFRNGADKEFQLSKRRDEREENGTGLIVQLDRAACKQPVPTEEGAAEVMSISSSAFQQRLCKFAVHFTDEVDADLLGAYSFALVGIRATAKALAVHSLYERFGPPVTLGVTLG